MKTIFVVIVLIFYCSILFGQDQIDSLIKQPKKIDKDHQHIIYDYRLPDWGYHRFYVNLSAISSVKDHDYENEIRKEQMYNGQINPSYYRYKISEKTTYTI